MYLFRSEIHVDKASTFSCGFIPRFTSPYVLNALFLLGCQLVVSWAERELSGNNTEAQIEQYLDTMCAHIPKTVQAEVCVYQISPVNAPRRLQH